MSLFIKSFTKFYFIIQGDSEYLFRNPGEDGDSYIFSDVLGGERKEGAAVFQKDEAKRIIKYLKNNGHKDVRMMQQKGLLVKDGQAFKEHNQGESNYDKDGNYKHTPKKKGGS